MTAKGNYAGTTASLPSMATVLIAVLTIGHLVELPASVDPTLPAGFPAGLASHLSGTERFELQDSMGIVYVTLKRRNHP